MSTRTSYFEIVRRGDGWLARFRGANGHKVFTSELYTRRATAERAIALLGEKFSVQGPWAVSWREVDERSEVES